MNRNTAQVSADDLARIRRAARLARFMDTAIRIPGIGVRVGADSVIGLVPGVGDIAGAVVGLFILKEARRLGLPNEKLVRMAINLGADAALGSVPVVGDVFDIYFKSHRRNVTLMREHFGLSDDDVM